MATKTKKPKAKGRSLDNGRVGILVDHETQEAVKSGVLKIDPFDDSCLEPATYDLRIGRKSIVTTASRVVDIPPTEPILLEPGAMAILETLEILHLPNRIVGRIGPKSSLQRRGIYLSAGPQIDPGFRGRLFVNLINLSPRPYPLRSEQRFLTIEFQYLHANPSRGYEGPYQDKTEISSEDFDLLLAYQSPTLADLHRGFTEPRENIKEISSVAREIPKFMDQLGTIDFGQRQKRGRAFQVEITTFTPEPYLVKKPMLLLVRENEDESITASFVDANIETSGDNEEEANRNLKDLIVGVFEQLQSEPPDKLGPRPTAQLAILNEFIQRPNEDC